MLNNLLLPSISSSVSSIAQSLDENPVVLMDNLPNIKFIEGYNQAWLANHIDELLLPLETQMAYSQDKVQHIEALSGYLCDVEKKDEIEYRIQSLKNLKQVEIIVTEGLTNDNIQSCKKLLAKSLMSPWKKQLELRLKRLGSQLVRDCVHGDVKLPEKDLMLKALQTLGEEFANLTNYARTVLVQKALDSSVHPLQTIREQMEDMEKKLAALVNIDSKETLVSTIRELPLELLVKHKINNDFIFSIYPIQENLSLFDLEIMLNQEWEKYRQQQAGISMAKKNGQRMPVNTVLNMQDIHSLIQVG